MGALINKLSPLLLLLSSSSASGLSVAKFFSSGMVLQEAPSTANVYGTYEEGQVVVVVSCLDGEDAEVIADQVGVKFDMNLLDEG